MAAIFLGCTFLIAQVYPILARVLANLCFRGTFKGKENKTTLTAKVCDLGGSTANKISPSVTHLLISESEWSKRGPKVEQVLDYNAVCEAFGKPRIFIVDQAWLQESIVNEEMEPAEEWDLELNADESDEEYDRQQREKKQAQKAQQKKRKGRHASEVSHSTETESSSPSKPSETVLGEMDVHCDVADKTVVHKSGNCLWDAMLEMQDEDKVKKYRIQIARSKSKNLFWFWAKSAMKKGGTLLGPMEESAACAAFLKKFKELTLIAWQDRMRVEAYRDKYTYIKPDIDFELDEFELDDEAIAALDAAESAFNTSLAQSASHLNDSLLDNLDESMDTKPDLKALEDAASFKHKCENTSGDIKPKVGDAENKDQFEMLYGSVAPLHELDDSNEEEDLERPLKRAKLETVKVEEEAEQKPQKMTSGDFESSGENLPSAPDCMSTLQDLKAES